MPTVLVQDGFRVVIYGPSRERGPPHVHVWKAGREVIIELPLPGGSQRIRVVAGMRPPDVAKAFRIVEDHVELLLRCWRKYHG